MQEVQIITKFSNRSGWSAISGICIVLESRALLRSGICIFLVGSLDSEFRIFTGFRIHPVCWQTALEGPSRKDPRPSSYCLPVGRRNRRRLAGWAVCLVSKMLFFLLVTGCLFMHLKIIALVLSEFSFISRFWLMEPPDSLDEKLLQLKMAFILKT